VVVDGDFRSESGLIGGSETYTRSCSRSERSIAKRLDPVPSAVGVGLVIVAKTELGTEPRKACEVVSAGMGVRGEGASSSYGSEAPDTPKRIDGSGSFYN